MPFVFKSFYANYLILMLTQGSQRISTAYKKAI